jgi:hypothetical protein
VFGALFPPVPACASLARPIALLLVLSGGCVASAPTAAPTVPGAAPWQIPRDEQGYQSLLRIQIATERGDASLRAVLRLASARQYEIAASDSLGRQLWTLSVAPGSALWQDHRKRQACWLGGEILLPDLGLPALRLAVLPALLLGRVPIEPAADSGHAAAASGGEVVDARGRWKWLADGEEILSWTHSQGEVPVLWWRREGGTGILSARTQGVQVRVRRVLKELLTTALAEPRANIAYSLGECDDLELP